MRYGMHLVHPLIWDQDLVFVPFCFALTMEQGSFLRIS